MKTHVQQWGNSLALRIPKIYAKEANLEHNSEVELVFENGKFIVTPILKTKPTLSDLLNKITKENIHKEIDTGFVVGKETC